MERSRPAEFLIGLTMGAVTALLFAPNSGRKTRIWITKTAGDGTAYVKDCGGTVLGFIEQSKDTITRHRHGVADAVKLGTDAYKRAVG